MVVFGKNVVRRAPLAVAAGGVAMAAPKVKTDSPRRQMRLGVLVTTIVLASTSAYGLARQLVADKTLAMPRDLRPGLLIEAPPYAPPEGCQVRDWKIGEFLPSACYVDQEVPLAYLAGYGLERPQNVYWRTRRHHFRPLPNYLERFWVRVGPDAVLVSAPSGASGQILTVVRDRFTGVDIFAMAAATAADARDYAAPPADYVRNVRRGLWTAPIVSFVMIVLLWLLTLLARDEEAFNDLMATEDPG